MTPLLVAPVAALAVLVGPTPATASPPEPAAVRIDGLAFHAGEKGCTLISANGANFACIEHRPSRLGVDTWVAFMGLSAMPFERFLIYSGPTTRPDARFIRDAGLREVNRRLVGGRFSRLTPVAVTLDAEDDHPAVKRRDDQPMFQVRGGDVQRWVLPKLGPWNRCFTHWTLVSAHRRGVDRLAVALRAELKANAPRDCRPAQGASTHDAPYHYMVMAAADAANVRTAVPHPARRLSGACAQLARCMAAMRGTELTLTEVRRVSSRSYSKSRCVRVLTQMRDVYQGARMAAGKPAPALPNVCVAQGR